MDIVILIISGFYFLFLILIWYGWKKIPVTHQSSFDHLFVSVIIPFRNEGENIVQILQDLSENNYNNQFEIILIDDHSTDTTREIANRWIEDHSVIGLDIKIVQLADGEGKKAAINLGINKSSGNLIITTDADCRLSKNWIKEIAGAFSQSDLIFGPVMLFDNGTIFSQLQIIEFMVLQVVSAATWRMGIPTMCNGANLAYLKAAFNGVKGFSGNEHIASGDDEFLMHKIYKENPDRLRFLKSKDAIVHTQPHQNILQFTDQRKRWAGKWKGYQHTPSTLLAVFIFISNLSFIIGFSAIFFGFINFYMIAVIFAMKFILEFKLIHTVRRFYSVKVRMFPFVLMQFIYPVYVVFFSIVSQFGGYVWKGRLVK